MIRVQLESEEEAKVLEKKKKECSMSHKLKKNKGNKKITSHVWIDSDGVTVQQTIKKLNWKKNKKDKDKDN